MAPDGHTVLHLISSLEAGGAQTMLYNIVTAPDSSPIRHRVVSMIEGGSLATRLRAHGIIVDSLHLNRGRPTAHAVLRFAGLVRRVRPDIVQTWMYHADLLGLVARPLAGARVIWNIRSDRHAGLRSPVTATCALLSGLPDAVIVNSAAGQRTHADLGYRPRRWELISNGFDLDVFRPSPENRASVRRELGLSADTPLIGLVARLDPLKGHDTFLAAAAIIARRRADAHFVLVGAGVTGENQRLVCAIATAGLSRRTHLLGQRSDVPRLTSALDVASLTSTGEAFPNVVGEAMACGVPCVATNVGDVAQIIDDPGLIFPPKDAGRLASIWEDILAMTPEVRQALGERGRTRIARSYSRDVIAKQYISLYNDMTRRL